MKAQNILKYLTLIAVVVAVVLGTRLFHESKATSYLSDDPAACINCHVMDSYYVSWQRSSHAQSATCVDCHLPASDPVDMLVSKARDGWNHSVAFTLNTYNKRLLISDDGARRVQQNCIRCHAAQSQPVTHGSDGKYAYGNTTLDDRKCWDCHRLVPHGKVRSINSSPNNLSVTWTR